MAILQQLNGVEYFIPGPPFHQRDLFRLKGTLTGCCWVSLLSSFDQRLFSFKSSPVLSHQKEFFKPFISLFLFISNQYKMLDFEYISNKRFEIYVKCSFVTS